MRLQSSELEAAIEGSRPQRAAPSPDIDDTSNHDILARLLHLESVLQTNISPLSSPHAAGPTTEEAAGIENIISGLHDAKDGLQDHVLELEQVVETLKKELQDSYSSSSRLQDEKATIRAQALILEQDVVALKDRVLIVEQEAKELREELEASRDLVSELLGNTDVSENALPESDKHCSEDVGVKNSPTPSLTPSPSLNTSKPAATSPDSDLAEDHSRDLDGDWAAMMGGWTNEKALSHFKLLLTAFPAKSHLASFHDVPWPTLHCLSTEPSPSLQSLDEAAFFVYMQSQCSAEEYRDLMKRTYGAFIPGYWSSRKYANGFKDKSTRRDVLSAAQRVSSLVTGMFMGLDRASDVVEDTV